MTFRTGGLTMSFQVPTREAGVIPFATVRSCAQQNARAGDFHRALGQTVTRPGLPSGGSFTLAAFFQGGFQVQPQNGSGAGDGHHLGENNRSHFNITPRSASRDGVQGILDHWVPKLEQLRQSNQRLAANNDMDPADLQSRIRVVAELDAIVAKLRSLLAVFDQHPHIKEITF